MTNDDPTRQRSTNERSAGAAQAAGSEDYIGVVAGGYDEIVPTDSFKVVVNSKTPSRFKDEVCRGTIVRVNTEAWKLDGTKWTLTTYGNVDDVNITPGFAFSNAKQMGQSSYYRDDTFRDVYSSTAEDSIELIVKAVGHEDEQGELYGPVRPPERESAVYLAQPDQVRKVLMRPVTNVRRFLIGAYATLKGLYSPTTLLFLGKEQIFLHGAMFAASGWGKTVAMKHLIQEFLSVDDAPAILVFNIKGQDFYDLEREMTEDQWSQIRQKNRAVAEIWKDAGYRRNGISGDRVTYYPLSRVARGRRGKPYGLRFSSLAADREGITSLLRLLTDANLPPASSDYLVEYFLFFKQHFTEHATSHDASRPMSSSWTGEAGDTFANFVSVLENARRQARSASNFTIFCEDCGRDASAQSVNINSWTSDAILRALKGLERLNIFDVGTEISIARLFTPGHISVIDVATNDSPRAQEIFIRHLLQGIFNYVNRREFEETDISYQGLAIFLDEAWRFFRSETVLDVVETISRMGRSLRIGLWLADQSIPTGAAETTILNNLRTRILGTMSAESVSQIKRIIPLDDKLLASLQNLRRGTGMFFNLEYSRIPVPCVIPACRCFHGEESEL
jgi:DNA helicase HerA-like ATPase